jgi:serine-type D-Ala-D-Ala carboxypeptidase/endopeptidase (penicillin-binding protein 4)
MEFAMVAGKPMMVLKNVFVCLLILIAGTLAPRAHSRADGLSRTDTIHPSLQQRLKGLIGPNDAVAVKAPDGSMVAAIHSDRLLVPASILKVLTSLAALHHLGEDYRFPTDFFMGPDGSLKIKGYGDPLLVSEQIAALAKQIAGQIDQFENLILDADFFAHPIRIPGRGRSAEPYDAPNGALCVNFNTVNFMRRSGQWVSAEPQTPLLPSVIPKIESSGLSAGRITMAGGNAQSLYYAGEMFHYFFSRAGIKMKGSIMAGQVNPQTDRLLWKRFSEVALTRVVADLLKYSKNFIANQLMLALGATQIGSPATVDKGLRVLSAFYRDELGITTGSFVEASGLSRDNRISAEAYMKILKRFEPYHNLLCRQGRQYYKTGTLSGIRTRAGYLAGKDDGLYHFVVMFNTPGKTTDRAMRLIEQFVQ